MSKSQRLTWMLAAACLLLLGLTLAEFFGFGSGYRLAPDAKSERPPAQALKLDEGARKLPPWPEYGSDMLARPIFNEDRKPTPVNAKKDETAAQPLKAALTGVIIAGELKLAMIKDEPSSKTVRLRPGQSLPGEQSPWKLVDVRPRSVTFEASGMGQQELKLQVSDKPNVAPPPQPGEKPAVGQSGLLQSAPANDPFYGQLKQQPAPHGDVNPDEIRRRIEERRKQLREEAQRMEQEQKH
jgi:general secretion pathway protein N